MALFNEILPEFNRFNAQLLGISEDGVWSHIAFSRARNLRFPLLSDFHPKGSVARQYGVYREEDGTAEREHSLSLMSTELFAGAMFLQLA